MSYFVSSNNQIIKINKKSIIDVTTLWVTFQSQFVLELYVLIIGRIRCYDRFFGRESRFDFFFNLSFLLTTLENLHYGIMWYKSAVSDKNNGFSFFCQLGGMKFKEGAAFPTHSRILKDGHFQKCGEEIDPEHDCCKIILLFISLEVLCIFPVITMSQFYSQFPIPFLKIIQTPSLSHLKTLEDSSYWVYKCALLSILVSTILLHY